MLSCTKVQVFLLALLAWVLPAFVLLRLERQVGSSKGADMPM